MGKLFVASLVAAIAIALVIAVSYKNLILFILNINLIKLNYHRVKCI